MVTGDAIFFSAVQGVTGAMGHAVRQATGADQLGEAQLVILDFANLPLPVGALPTSFDPLRAAAFIPQADAAAFNTARAYGIAHVHRRGALATELPRIVAEYAGLE